MLRPLGRVSNHRLNSCLILYLFCLNEQIWFQSKTLLHSAHFGKVQCATWKMTQNSDVTLLTMCDLCAVTTCQLRKLLQNTHTRHVCSCSHCHAAVNDIRNHYLYCEPLMFTYSPFRSWYFCVCMWLHVGLFLCFLLSRGCDVLQINRYNRFISNTHTQLVCVCVCVCDCERAAVWMAQWCTSLPH